MKQQNSINKFWTMSTPVTLSLVWLRATRGAGNPNLQVSITHLPRQFSDLNTGVYDDPTPDFVDACCRIFLIFLFFGKAKAGTKRTRGPHGTVFVRLKNMKKRAPVLLSIGSGLLSVLTVHSLRILHSGHLRWSKSESSVCHPCSQPNLGR